MTIGDARRLIAYAIVGHNLYTEEGSIGTLRSASVGGVIGEIVATAYGTSRLERVGRLLLDYADKKAFAGSQEKS